MFIDKKIINWLLEGDVSIQYQVYRDLLGIVNRDLEKRIESEGWGLSYLSKRKSDLNWGQAFYQPKWIATHYTLLDLRNLNLDRNNNIVKESINRVLDTNRAQDGGIMLGPSTYEHSDICVNGMFLNYASYFNTEETNLTPIVDCLLKEIMPDGGFNCRTTRSGAVHSSLHSTISVLEGLFEFQKNAYNYRLDDIKRAISSAEEFVLLHRLYLSDNTGEIIDKKFIKTPYPCRWRYDNLRALDYFQYSGKKFDIRMGSALKLLKNRRDKEGLWKVNASYPGKVHFIMEKAGKPSRWNTLRALRVLKSYNV